MNASKCRTGQGVKVKSKYGVIMISNIKTLFLMRSIVVLSLSSLLALGFFIGLIQLNLFPILLVQLIPILFILLTYKTQSKYSIEHHPFLIFLYLVTDVIYLGCFFSLFGGASNPLTGFYIIPILLSGLLLPFAWAIAIYFATVFAYFLNTIFFFPLNSTGFYRMTFHQLHQWGMLLSFLITAVLSLLVIFALLRNIRQKERALAESQSARELDTQLTKMGLVAVNSVHEMATPLSSLEMIFDYMQMRSDGDADTIDNGKKQLEKCKKTLARILKTFGQSSVEVNQKQTISQMLTTAMEETRITYPDVQIEIQSSEVMSIKLDGLFQDIIFNLLMNSAAVSKKIMCNFTQRNKQLIIEINDEGAGLSVTQQLQLSQSISTQMQSYLYDRASTHGIGLILVQYMLKRLNGSFDFSEAGKCYVYIPITEQENAD